MRNLFFIIVLILPIYAYVGCDYDGVGNWIVNDDLNCTKENQTIYLNGNLIINGGTLKLINSTLMINATAEINVTFNVNKGQFILINSTLTSTNYTYDLRFNPNSEITLENSIVEDSTIYINTNNYNATSTNVTFFNTVANFIYDGFTVPISLDNQTFELNNTASQNISSLEIQSDYGKISYLEPLIIELNQDLTAYINIPFNLIFVNSSALPELNKSAALILYNLSYSDESEFEITRDDETCPSAICNFSSYVNQNLTFNVSGFSRYSTRGRIPQITVVYPKSPEDPSSCIPTNVGTFQFNVTHSNFVNLTVSYVNVSKGIITHQTTSCIDAGGSGTNMTVNCTGLQMNYYDEPGSWVITAYVKSTANQSNSSNSTTMVYNEGTFLTINNQPFTFGNLPVGSNDNVNLESPSVNLENCGNVKLNTTITGSNISTASFIYSIPAIQFRLDDDIIPSEGSETGRSELVLSESAQSFNKVGGINIATVWNIWSFVNIPLGQSPGTYNQGYFTFTPSKY